MSAPSASELNRLLELARSEPSSAIREITTALADRDSYSGSDLSILLRAIGYASRLAGDLARSRLYLQDAVDEARLAGNDKLEIEAQLTLAGTMFISGETEAAEGQLRALQPIDDAQSANIQFQLGTMLARQGRNSQALICFDKALASIQDRDPLAEAYVSQGRAMLLLQMGDYESAREDIERAIALLEQLDIRIQLAGCAHSRGLIEAHSGDLPAAFSSFSYAEQQVKQLAGSEWEIQHGFCEALLSAGLHVDAASRATAAVENLAVAGFEVDRAEVLLVRAVAEEELGRGSAAASTAAEAARVFEDQGRDLHALEARMVELAAHPSIAGEQLARAAGEEFLREGWKDASLRALILAARLGGLEDPRRSAEQLTRLSRRVRAAPMATRIEHWSTLAELRLKAGKPTGARVAAKLAADLVESYRSVIQLGNLRPGLAAAAARANDVGLSLSIKAKNNRTIFSWLERAIRAASIHRLPEPVDDQNLRQRLTELSALPLSSFPTHDRRRRLESEIAAMSIGRSNPHDRASPSLQQVANQLGDRAMVMFGVATGKVVALRIATGRTRRFDLGPAEVVEDRIRAIRRELHVAAHRVDQTSIERVEALLLEVDQMIAAPVSGSESLAIIAPAGIAQLPWGSLPSRAGKPTTVSRSATAWCEADRQPRSGSGATLLVHGPDLEHADLETAAIASAVRQSHELQESTVDEAIAAMEEKSTVHIVSHGTLRTDNPLFSSLELDGGSLFAYQLLRLQHPPSVVVLSACHLGLGSGPAGRALLGFTDALLSAGVSSVIASTMPVPDTSVTASLMTELHRLMDNGARPATALANARAVLPEDTAALYTAAFTCFGAG